MLATVAKAGAGVCAQMPVDAVRPKQRSVVKAAACTTAHIAFREFKIFKLSPLLVTAAIVRERGYP
jgi:hypothetical protein